MPSSTPAAAHRYAVSYAPNPGSLGWLAGSHWLGRCAALLQPLQQLAIDGVADHTLQQLTAEPRRRGWQAPLQPPFALAEGADWMALHSTVQRLAHSLAPCALPPLHVERLGDFLALVPAARHAAHTDMAHAASECRTQLQPLVADAPCAGDTAQPVGGFRFHLPLTGSLAQVDSATQARVLDAAQDFFADLPTRTFHSLALFAEPTPGADFVLLDHLELGGRDIGLRLYPHC
ncbi:DUF1045 domain-containing protein [Paracidovorax sp. MALMAid1276]|uniref:DUF1045 domain-containing protein n=1 Tax=Paracidovorax sp. MALMAid1276 TaxID=3411631 RepID=UPI003B9A7531